MSHSFLLLFYHTKLYIFTLQERVQATFKAVLSGVPRDVENALERKALAMAKDEHGRSPLHLAILAGQDQIARNIVQNFPLAVKTRDNVSMHRIVQTKK
jgi:hypothetical protein